MKTVGWCRFRDCRGLLSEMQLTKTISESVEKVRASVDRPARVAQEKE
jgi:hypothetical protein